MSPPQERDETLDDEYDEEADSDFEGDGSAADSSSASEAEEQEDAYPSSRPRKRRKIDAIQQTTLELDSGDEATIKGQRKPHSKGKPQQQRAAGDVSHEDGHESEVWRARTRAMRIQEKKQKRDSKLASSKHSTIDVNKLWEEMNRPGPLPPLRIEGEGTDKNMLQKPAENGRAGPLPEMEQDKENVPVPDDVDTVTIKRTYKFAGEVHTEEKTVQRNSAEAQLWLAQQQGSKTQSVAMDGKIVQRPLRKISRFDPNLNNIGSFGSSWSARNAEAQDAYFKGPKLNVVEKSKMDWAAHVDTEGLKEELDVHAKAKDGYLNRMDFLREVEVRKEEEARAARLQTRG
jgi:hypothetical protein